MRKHFEVNGMLVVDRLLRAHGLVAEDEVWVHGMWLPRYWAACLKAKLKGKKLVRMTHGSLDPVRLKYSAWKKRLVTPIERVCYRLADRVVATGEWEVEWARAWGLKREIEIVDLKRFFRLDGGVSNAEAQRRREGVLHVLYLGRRHPLKGVEYLDKAVKELEERVGEQKVELRIVSDHTGEELEKDWEWCDVLCLPTLSENFGLVVAEALERGKRVITTDGAPAFAPDGATVGKPATPGIVKGYDGSLLYLEGYRDGSAEARVRLLKEAIEAACGNML